MRKRNRNLQPWLDYFGMLQEYESNGLLQVEPEKHEAYVTQAALATLYGADVHADSYRGCRECAAVMRRVRAYAGWMSREGGAYMDRSFAMHVVKDDAPHDLLFTVLLTRRRRWWALWRRMDSFDVIDYSEGRAAT